MGKSDVEWMKEAFQLAKKGLGRTAPNPMVGAVVVKDGRRIASGWHRGPGSFHAERVALDQAGDAARGATLYVTLEPCCHYGRTPPCVERIVASGVAKVVAAMEDPNPVVAGQGFRQLEAAGIEVVVGVLEHEARLVNRAYVAWTSERRPYVHLKTAQSLDGRVATRLGESKWITSEEARRDGHRLRARVGAIVVGVGTVLADDPSLTARPRGSLARRQPLRVILDSDARTPPEAQCLRPDTVGSLVAVTSSAPKARVDQLRSAGAEVWVSPPALSGRRVHLRALLDELARRGIAEIMVEGGPTAAGAFVDNDLVDELRLYVSGVIIGGEAARPAIGGTGAGKLSQALRLIDAKWVRVGPDWRLTARTPRAFLGDRPR